MLLSVDNLTVSFGATKVVDNVSFTVDAAEPVGIVGESGSGKSMTALSLLRLVPEPGRIASGRIQFAGHDLLSLPEKQIRALRGGRIAMVFQEPMTSLNPVFTIGNQIQEAIDLHQAERSRAERSALVLESLRQVKIADPKRVAAAYPHELSGGMRQRAMIAMALACRPELLIADEPTTALDVTIQAQILELLRELQASLKMALILITHDLGIVAETVRRVVVMEKGRVVEQGGVDAIFTKPRHPYTQSLLEMVRGLERRVRA